MFRLVVARFAHSPEQSIDLQAIAGSDVMLMCIFLRDAHVGSVPELLFSLVTLTTAAIPRPFDHEDRYYHGSYRLGVSDTIL